MIRLNARHLIAAALVVAAGGSAAPATAQISTKSPTSQVRTAAAPAAVESVETFAGKVPGSNAYLAVVNRGGVVQAYLCDSAKVATWFTGNLLADGLFAANKAGNVTLIGSRSGSSLTASLASGGKSTSVKLSLVAAPAGLYEAFSGTKTGEAIRAGWILLPDGTQRGNRLVGGAVNSVPALQPTQISVNIGGVVNGVAVSPTISTAIATAVGSTGPVTAQKSMCEQLKSNYDFWHQGAVDANKIQPPTAESTANLQTAIDGMTSHFDKAKAAGCAWTGAGTAV